MIAPKEGIKVTPIKMVCLHGQVSVYPRQKVQVEVQGVTTEIPVGIVKDLPY